MSYFLFCLFVVITLIGHWVEEVGERERLLDEKIRRGIK